MSGEIVKRVGLCREQIETSPYSHTVAAGWYVEDVPKLLEWLYEYERWAGSMPDAGMTATDDLSKWYYRRPQYPNFRAPVSFQESERR